MIPAPANGKPSSVPFLIALAGFVLASSALLLLIPVLFGPHQTWHEVGAGVLVAIAVLLGVIMFRLRPDSSQMDKPDSKQ
jgi:hypothetical protein